MKMEQALQALEQGTPLTSEDLVNLVGDDNNTDQDTRNWAGPEHEVSGG